MQGMNFIELWNRFQAEERAKAKLAEYRKLSTDELKTLWNGFDGDAEEGQTGFFWPDDSPHIEDVHLLLNEREEGEYCAV